MPIFKSNSRQWHTLRSNIRKIPYLGRGAGALGDVQRFFVKFYQIRTLPKIRVYENFSAFAPNSAGTPIQRTELTVSTIKRIFPELERLTSFLAGRETERVMTVDEFITHKNFDKTKAIVLGDLFQKYGSDKSNPNNYYYVYAYLISLIENPKNILEIGMGTNNLGVVSNMGVFGSPGASLRAFKEYLPFSTIYGADIDHSILFNEERISTTWVDQTKPESLHSMFVNFDRRFDLIIDDGLHSPDANISTLISAMEWCATGGFIVIEDIAQSARSIWVVVQALLEESGVRAQLIAGTNADIFIVEGR